MIQPMNFRLPNFPIAKTTNSSNFNSIDTSQLFGENLPKEAPLYDNHSCFHNLPSYELQTLVFDRGLGERLNGDLPPSYERVPAPHHTHLGSNGLSDGDLVCRPDNKLIDNLCQLSNIDIPLDVSFVLTPVMPVVGRDYKKQDILKQYYPGEMLYGYLIVKNNSRMDIPFNMLLVSLEGEIGASSKTMSKHVTKKILNMIDLEASIFNSNAYSSELDPDTLECLTTKVIKSGVSFRRIFKFKIPEMILDEKGVNIAEQLFLPPSTAYQRSLKESVSPISVIDPVLGYGKYPNSDSLVIFNEISIPGEFCHYFINFQLIGKKEDILKLKPKSNPKDSYNFVTIKQHRHFFRVGNYDQKHNFEPDYLSTSEFFLHMDSCIKHTTKLLNQKQNLETLNTLASPAQRFTQSKSDIKKFVLKVGENPIRKKANTSNFTAESNNFHEKSFSLKLNKCFSKHNGSFLGKFRMKKKSFCKSIQPGFVEFSSYNSLMNFDQKFSPTLEAELQFILPTLTNCRTTPPQTIMIKPKLKVIDVQSIAGIPMLIDEDFILSDCPDIQQYFKKFQTHFKKILTYKDVIRDCIPSETMDLIKQMALLEYRDIEVDKIFKPHEISLKDKWIFDPLTKSYHCSFDLKVEYDLESLFKVPRLLGPSFQTLLIARLHKIEFEVTTKKSGKKTVSFPVTFS